MSKNLFRSSLVISSGTLSANELLRLFGAAKTIERGSSISSAPSSQKRTQAVWTRESELPETSHPHEHVAEFINLLQTKWGEIESVRNQIQIDIWIMISHEKDQCGFSFESTSLTSLSELGINLVFDLYR